MTACSPKEASVDSKPFEQTENQGFETLSMNEPLKLNQSSWFFWKNHDDMKTVLKLGAGLEILQAKLASTATAKVKLVQQRDNYLLESLGPDNKVIWEEFEAKISALRTESLNLYDLIEAEESKPETDRDEGHISQMRQQWADLQESKKVLIEQRNGVEQQSGMGQEFRAKIEGIDSGLATFDENLTSLKKTAQQYQLQLSQLVELIPDSPKLILQEKSTGLYIELVDFQKGDVTCSTDTGLIRDVTYKKSEGYIEFTAICKQPEGMSADRLVSYKIVLEKIPTAPSILLSGNMARCIDILPNVGKCEASLTYGVVKYLK